MKDWTREVPVAEDDAQDPEDAVDVPPCNNVEDAVDAKTDALATSAADADLSCTSPGHVLDMSCSCPHVPVFGPKPIFVRTPIPPK